MNENITNIINKIEKYDEENETEFAKIVREKLEKATKFDSGYFRGIVHGILLILVSLEVVTRNDAVYIMGVITPNMSRY